MFKKNTVRILGGWLLFFTVWEMVHLVFPLLPPPWPPLYWALPLHGQVVEADSGKPLVGVIVVADWGLDAPWVGKMGKRLAVMETVTSDQGGFVLCWLHPRLRWPFIGQLSSDSPTLSFFKPGYEWEVCNNDVFRANSLNPFPSADCSGRTIRLKKFQGTAQEYSENVGQLSDNLGFAFHPENCSWRKIPQMLVAIDQELTLAAKKRVYPRDSKSREHGMLAYWETKTSAHCGSIKKFLRSYMP